MLAQTDCSRPQYKVMAKTYVAPPTGIHKDFAMRFREACARARLPSALKTLSKIFGVSAPTVHDWRHGELLPSSANMAAIAAKTGVNVDWLATGRGTPDLPSSPDAQRLARRIEAASPETRRYIEAILTISETDNPINLSS